MRAVSLDLAKKIGNDEGIVADLISADERCSLPKSDFVIGFEACQELCLIMAEDHRDYYHRIGALDPQVAECLHIGGIKEQSGSLT